MIDFEDAKNIGSACLATVRSVLTGLEIEACEWTQEDGFEEDCESMGAASPEEPSKDNYTLNQEDEYEEDLAKWRMECRQLGSDQSDFERRWEALKSLAIQFSREIGDFIETKGREASRRAVETHNRLQLSHQ